MRKGCLEKEKTVLLGRTEHKGERERKKSRGWHLGHGMGAGVGSLFIIIY